MRWPKALGTLAFLLLGGCLRSLFPTAEPGSPVSGLLYSETWYPLTLNHCGEPRGSFPGKYNYAGQNDVKSIREPVTGVGIRVAWDSNAIGDIAKKYGIEKIYFADIHNVSVLFGIWSQYEVCVTGEVAPHPPKETP